MARNLLERALTPKLSNFQLSPRVGDLHFDIRRRRRRLRRRYYNLLGPVPKITLTRCWKTKGWNAQEIERPKCNYRTVRGRTRILVFCFFGGTCAKSYQW